MLTVLQGERRVGQLWTAERILHFRYDAEWRIAPDAFPLSPRLPLAIDSHSGDEVALFFSNLLPEGPVLAAILKLRRLPAGDLYAQLEAFGEDAAGAFAVVPEGQERQRTPHDQPYPLAAIQADLARLADHLPLLAQHGELRLSLAGAQNKIPVKYAEGAFWLPAGGAASTHILKPAIQPTRQFPDSVRNEALCLRLADACGLRAVEAAVVGVPEPVLVVRRYDRITVADSVQRFHQLDFCQLAGVLPDQKYEKDGGPSLAMVFSLVDRHAAAPARDRLALLDGVLFNYLIGNADAHAKNLAMQVEPGGRLRLAPLYDVLCTVIYPHLDTRMALAIGGEFRPEWVREANWRRFAESVQINPALLRKRALRLAKRMSDHLPRVAALPTVGADGRLVERIGQVIAQRTRWLAIHQAGLSQR